MRRARYLLVPATALALGVLPAAAEDHGHDIREAVTDVGDPTPEVVLEGRGWGHGVGMSQHGAYAMARDGHDVDDILGYYFTDAERAAATDLGAAIDDVPVRVGLASSTSRRDVEQAIVELGQDNDEAIWQACDEEGCEQRAVQNVDVWRVLAEEGGLRVEEEADDGWEEVFATDVAELRVGADSDDPLDVRGVDRAGDNVAHRIVGRGTHEIHDVTDWEARGDAAGRLSTVQRVDDLEQYLYGLDEMEAGRPAAALQAQAVLGRTYAATRIGGDAAGLCRCDLGATSRDQMYRGWSKEHETRGGVPLSGPWLAAVEETAGDVLAHEGTMAQYPVYSSSHGGASENVEDSWAFSTFVPYLRHVEDEYSLHEGNRRRAWTADVDHDLLIDATQDAFAGEVVAIERFDIRTTTEGGTPREIDLVGRGPNGDVVDATLGNDETGTVAGNSIRNGLRGHVLRTVDADGNVEQLRGLLSAQIAQVGFAPFADDIGRVHEYAAAWAAEAGITEGVDVDRFDPTGDVTRRQMAAFLYRTFAMPEPADQDQFEDAGDAEPQREAINALAEAGIAAGFDDGTFRPGEHVTRAQMATFLARAVGLDDVPANGRFSDVDESPHAGAIHAVADAGIAVGREDGTFRPGRQVSREQMASFLRRTVAVS